MGQLAIFGHHPAPCHRRCVGIVEVMSAEIPIAAILRTALLLSGLLSCSLNIVVFWVYMVGIKIAPN